MNTREICNNIRQHFLHKSFGIIQFWGFGLVPPNDQSFLLTQAHDQGDCLELIMIHESGDGPESRIQVWSPGNLILHSNSLSIEKAQHLKWRDVDARLDGLQFEIKTPRGVGKLPIEGSPALLLSR